MKYKAFQDWYHEGNIKHLLLFEHDGHLISPPFATERCKEYNKIMKYDGTVSYIDTELPPATSKTNSVIYVNGSSWFIPYGIYDEFNTVLQLKNDTPIYHTVELKGKGQFYSGATNSVTGFSFPLGYEGTQYALYIENDKPKVIPFESLEKAHMGTIYANGRYWSMPRSDVPGYVNLVSFDGNDFEYYPVPVNPDVTRKFTDLIAIDDIIYSLPFGETPGLSECIEFDTTTHIFNKHTLNVPDFAKKFNSMVKLGNNIVGMPYGDEYSDDSNYGVIFDIVTKESKPIDINIGAGGKYRYRSGIEYHGLAVFFPSGSPQYPIITVNSNGDIHSVLHYPDIMFGRPIIHKNILHIIGYNIHTEKHYLYVFDSNLEYTVVEL